jgi:hypothetical protein
LEREIYKLGLFWKLFFLNYIKEFSVLVVCLTYLFEQSALGLISLLVMCVGLFVEKKNKLGEIGVVIFVSSSFLILSIYVLNLTSIKSNFD